ncbi:MAG: HNH endonuclease [Bacillota bacterium]
MKESRLKLLPELLEKYKHKLVIDVISGIVTGLKPYENHKGYLTLNFWYNGGSKYYRVHEIIAYAGGLELLNNTVNHINGDKKDNRLLNLEAIPALENHIKAKNTKSFLTGDANPSSKLTAEQVSEIRRASTGRWGEQSELANEYGVHQTTIYSILSFQTWKDAKDEEENK